MLKLTPSRECFMSNPSIRTLFITKYPPYPPVGGSPLRNWQNITRMMKLGPVAIFSIAFDRPASNAELPPDITIYNYYNVRDLRKQRSVWKKIKHRMWQQRPCGHPWADWFDSDIVAQELSQAIAKFQPHIVIFEEPWFHHYFNIVKRQGCLTIYDAHNIETVLQRDLTSSLPQDISKVNPILLAKKIEIIERDLISKVDQIWVCSKEDKILVDKLGSKIPPIHIVPNGLDVASYDSVRLRQCPPPNQLDTVLQSIIFTARFGYPPNSEAAQILIDQIYPHLRETFPNTRLMLVGIEPTQYMRQAAKQDSGIVVTGPVSDVRPYLAAASVVVVPLWQGGGTRLKILEAFAAGRPVVSTPKGVEGIKVKDGEQLLIRDSIEEFVAGVSQLLSEPAFGQKLADSAYNLVKSNYAWDKLSPTIEQAVLELMEK